jgi:hypothetical protein
MRHVAWRDSALAESVAASQGLWTVRRACAVCEVALVGRERWSTRAAQDVGVEVADRGAEIAASRGLLGCGWRRSARAGG